MVAGLSDPLTEIIVRFDADLGPFERKLNRAIKQADVFTKKFEVVSPPIRRERGVRSATVLDADSQDLEVNQTGLQIPGVAIFRKIGEAIVEVLIGAGLVHLIDPDRDVEQQLFDRPLDIDLLAKAFEGLGEEADKLEREVAAFRERSGVVDEPNQQKLDRAADFRTVQDKIIGVLAAERQRLRQILEGLQQRLPDSLPGVEAVKADLEALDAALRRVTEGRPGLARALDLRTDSTTPRVPPVPEAKPEVPESFPQSTDLRTPPLPVPRPDFGRVPLEPDAAMLGADAGAEIAREICACLETLFSRAGILDPDGVPSETDPSAGTGGLRPAVPFSRPSGGFRTDALERQLGLVAETNEAVEAQSRAWQQVIGRTGEVTENLVETERAVVDVDKVARDLGFTFASAFEDAVVNGESFGDILEGLERDILRILTRTLLTEPIAAGIRGGISGLDPSQGGLESIFNTATSPLGSIFSSGTPGIAGPAGGGEDGAAAALAEVASAGAAASAGLTSAGTGATAAGSQLGGGLVTGVLETIAVKAIETGTSQSLIASLIALEVSATAAAAALTNVAGSSAASSFAGLTVGGGATGGLVRGPGSGTSDSIPMRLSNGDFVMSAAATRRHRGLLEALNRDLVPAPLARPGARPPVLSPGLARAPQPDATRRRQAAPLPPINITMNVGPRARASAPGRVGTGRGDLRPWAQAHAVLAA